MCVLCGCFVNKVIGDCSGAFNICYKLKKPITVAADNSKETFSFFFFRENKT